jgi:Methyltransferase FkbM domain
VAESRYKANENYAGIWNRKLTVPMITLDTLIERYGIPDYIKIDVEGYEEKVLTALSICPPLLSFEFNRTFLDSAFRVIDNNIFAAAFFNYTLVDPIKFELQTWVDQSEMKRKIGELQAGSGLGDIFVSLARRP